MMRSPPADLTSGHAPGSSGSRSWFWLLAAVAALGLALGGLALVQEGALLERLLAPLAGMQQPLVELAAASRGDAGAEGVEYVIFLRDDAAPSSLDRFFRDTPAVRYVSPGLLPGVVVVRIVATESQGGVASALAALRTQPQVRMALKSRLGMVCH